MAVRQRSARSWEITLEQGNRRDVVTGQRRRERQTITVRGARNRAEAEAVERELLRQLAEGTLDVPTRMTVGELLDLFLANYATNKAPGTYQKYREVAEQHLRPALGHIRLSQLKPLDVVRHQTEWRKRGPGVAFVSRIVLNSALRAAKRWQILRHHPLEDVEWPALPRTPQRICTEAEARRVVARALDPASWPWGAGAWLQLHTGLRSGELCGLAWHPDVDVRDVERARIHPRRQLQTFDRRTIEALRLVPLERSRVLVELKSEASRGAVRLASDAVALLDRYRTWQAQAQRDSSLDGRPWPVHRDAQGQRVELVFRSERGQSWDPREYRRRFGQLVVDAGIADGDRLTPHSLRRTMGALLFGLDASTKEVQDRLRHSRHQTTELYYHELIADVQDRTTERYAALLRPGVPAGDHTASADGRVRA